jgi:hypothetical protein
MNSFHNKTPNDFTPSRPAANTASYADVARQTMRVTFRGVPTLTYPQMKESKPASEYHKDIP